MSANQPGGFEMAITRFYSRSFLFDRPDGVPMHRRFLKACWVGAFCLFALSANPAQAITMKERIVLGSFNMCWQAEDGANLEQALRENGFTMAPQATTPLYFRQESGTTVLFASYFGEDSDGGRISSCRITALKPQIDSRWTPTAPIFSEFSSLLDRIVQGAANMGSGYRHVAARQPIAQRPGHARTLLRLDEGSRARMIYIEEGPTYYEFVYFNSTRAVVDDPGTLDAVIQPAARAAMQAFVDDGWEVAFCNLNPQNCLTPEQQRQQEAMAANAARNRAPISIPFSGIGSTRSGDNRTNEQRLRDKSWWENYHRCGSGRC